MDGDLEWKIEKPIVVEGKEYKFTVQCRECKDFFSIPARPMCDVCRVHMDICFHGIACIKCAPKLMFEWIQEGSLKKGDIPDKEFGYVQKMIQEKFGKEIYIDEEDFIRIR